MASGPERARAGGGVGAEVAAEVRVRYADTDRMGVAYYANYLVWFEVGRNEYMRAVGYPYARLERESAAAVRGRRVVLAQRPPVTR